MKLWNTERRPGTAARILILFLAAMMLCFAGCGAGTGSDTSAPEKDQAPEADAKDDAATAPEYEHDVPDRPGDEEETEEGEKPAVLVVFFSRTGHTRPLAEYAAEELDADIYEIEAKIPYTDEDIQYYTNSRADKEQNDPYARPEIGGTLPDVSGYDTVFIGYPIWHGQAPKIVYTFLESVDMSGKRIIPFCTSGSSPLGSSAENMHPLAPESLWDEGRRFEIGTSREEISDWVKSLDI